MYWFDVVIIRLWRTKSNRQQFPTHFIWINSSIDFCGRILFEKKRSSNKVFPYKSIWNWNFDQSIIISNHKVSVAIHFWVQIHSHELIIGWSSENRYNVIVMWMHLTNISFHRQQALTRFISSMCQQSVRPFTKWTQMLHAKTIEIERNSK